ncbi:MAG: Gldg family protein [Planctomycetaceae bacterium]
MSQNTRQRQARWGRLAQYGLIATALAALNGGAWVLPRQIDLTASGSFTLAPQTRNLLAGLERPLSVTILAPRTPRTVAEREFSQAAAMLDESLGLFRSVQPAVQVAAHDPESSAEGRALLAKYSEATAPCVIIELAGGHEILQAGDLAAFHARGAGRPPAVEFFGESALAGAITRLSSGSRQCIVYALQNHGELRCDDSNRLSRRGMGLYVERLRELDFDVRPLDLRATARVPDDIGLLLIAGNEAPLVAEEIETVKRYLAHGGRALLLCDANYDPVEGRYVECAWQPLLTDLGVLLGQDRIVTRGFTGQFEAASPASSAGGDHSLVRTLPAAPVVLYECRSVRRMNDVETSNWVVDPVLVSHAFPQAWAERGAPETVAPEFNQEHDLPGPVGMAVAVSRRRGAVLAPALVVVGDAEFLSNDALSQPAGRSGFAFALSSLNWLRGRPDLLGDIPARKNEAYLLTGTATQQRGLVWKPTLFLSALILAAGATTWVSRR